MPAWLPLVLFVVVYVTLTQWLLPKLGVPTWRTGARPVGSRGKDAGCDTSPAPDNPQEKLR